MGAKGKIYNINVAKSYRNVKLRDKWNWKFYAINIANKLNLRKTIREERRLRVFENRVLRRVFGPKRDEVTGGWRKLHNEELHKLYSSSSIIRMIKSRRMRWAGHVA
jgi:hypothetical protein